MRKTKVLSIMAAITIITPNVALASSSNDVYSAAVNLVRAKAYDNVAQRINDLMERTKNYILNTGDFSPTTEKVAKFFKADINSWRNFDKNEILQVSVDNKNDRLRVTNIGSTINNEKQAEIFTNNNILDPAVYAETDSKTKLIAIPLVLYKPYDSVLSSFKKLYSSVVTSDPKAVISPVAPSDSSRTWYKPDGKGNLEKYVNDGGIWKHETTLKNKSNYFSDKLKTPQQTPDSIIAGSYQDLTKETADNGTIGYVIDRKTKTSVPYVYVNGTWIPVKEIQANVKADVNPYNQLVCPLVWGSKTFTDFLKNFTTDYSDEYNAKTGQFSSYLATNFGLAFLASDPGQYAAPSPGSAMIVNGKQIIVWKGGKANHDYGGAVFNIPEGKIVKKIIPLSSYIPYNGYGTYENGYSLYGVIYNDKQMDLIYVPVDGNSNTHIFNTKYFNENIPLDIVSFLHSNKIVSAAGIGNGATDYFRFLVLTEKGKVYFIDIKNDKITEVPVNKAFPGEKAVKLYGNTSRLIQTDSGKLVLLDVKNPDKPVKFLNEQTDYVTVNGSGYIKDTLIVTKSGNLYYRYSNNNTPYKIDLSPMKDEKIVRTIALPFNHLLLTNKNHFYALKGNSKGATITPLTELNTQINKESEKILNIARVGWDYFSIQTDKGNVYLAKSDGQSFKRIIDDAKKNKIWYDTKINPDTTYINVTERLSKLYGKEIKTVYPPEFLKDTGSIYSPTMLVILDEKGNPYFYSPTGSMYTTNKNVNLVQTINSQFKNIFWNTDEKVIKINKGSTLYTNKGNVYTINISATGPISVAKKLSSTKGEIFMDNLGGAFIVDNQGKLHPLEAKKYYSGKYYNVNLIADDLKSNGFNLQKLQLTGLPPYYLFLNYLKNNCLK